MSIKILSPREGAAWHSLTSDMSGDCEIRGLHDDGTPATGWHPITIQIGSRAMSGSFDGTMIWAAALDGQSVEIRKKEPSAESASSE